MEEFLKLIANCTVKNRGGTFDTRECREVTFDSGYIVGLKGGEMIGIPAYLPAQYPCLLEGLKRHMHPQIGCFGPLLGTWVHPSGAYVCVDPVVHMHSLVLALTRGRMNNQESIWDCENKKEIWL